MAAGYGKRVRKIQGKSQKGGLKRGIGTTPGKKGKKTSRGTGKSVKKGGVRKQKFDSRKFNKQRAQVFGLSEDNGKA